MGALFRDKQLDVESVAQPSATLECYQKRGVGIPTALSSIRALGGTVCVDRFRGEGAKVSVLVPALGVRHPTQ